MKSYAVKPHRRLSGKISLLGDKSIAHRAALLAALSENKTVITNFPANDDCLATLACLRKLGVRIDITKKSKYSLTVTIYGKGLKGLKKSASTVFIKESGTTYRLLLGVLAGQDFSTKLAAGDSLSKRPMRRVTQPLRLMGATIISNLQSSTSKLEEYPPITIKGGALHGITYKMPVASAQVKSAILLAGLFAKGSTSVIEPIQTRDHTERMLKVFKAGLSIKKNKITVTGGMKLISPKSIYVPGDISSAAFFIVASAITPGSSLLIKNVSLNPTRCGVLRVLKRMGVYIALRATSSELRAKSCEPMGDLLVKSSFLKGTVVKRSEIPSLIDELPILMVAASLAKGKTIFEGAGELRVKETDRITSMTDNLKKMGVKICVQKSGSQENIMIRGVKILQGAKVRSFGDHRTVMSMIIAGLIASKNTRIDDISCINKSSPDFIYLLNRLIS